MIEAMAKHRWLRRTLGLGLLAGGAYAIWRAVEANRTAPRQEWEAQPFPFPPQPRTDAPPPPTRAPTRDGWEKTDDAAQRAERAELAGERTPAGRVPRPAESEREMWVGPVDGTCPVSHPVKAKESSRIFHVPGGSSYERTVPDRCYADPAAAEADGFRAAKR